MIFHSYKLKTKQKSQHKTAASFTLLSKSQSFRNTGESQRHIAHMPSLQTILKNTYISRNKDKTHQKYTNSKVGVCMRTGIQSQLKKRVPKKEEVRDNLNNTLGLSASIWYLYDSKSKKHIGFRQEVKREIASLTKIMTTILSIEIMQRFGIPLDLKVKITNASKSMIGTSADLKAGYWITLRDLLYGVMLPSGNDAAYSISEYMGFILTHSNGRKNWIQLQKEMDVTKEVSTVSYVQQFIRAMNWKAKQLKLQNTCFSNPHGLANAMNTSSARDIMKISRHSVKNAKFSKVMNSKSHHYALYQSEHGGKVISGTWKNTNVLLQKGWQGVKTGHTPTAGGCLSSLKDGIFIVVLNSENDETRFSDTEKLYLWYTSRNGEHTLKNESKRTVFETVDRKEVSVLTVRPRQTLKMTDQSSQV